MPSVVSVPGPQAISWSTSCTVFCPHQSLPWLRIVILTDSELENTLVVTREEVGRGTGRGWGGHGMGSKRARAVRALGVVWTC